MNKLVFIVVAFFISGCVNANNIERPQDVISFKQKLNAEQIKKLLVGHTYPLSKGEIYFSSSTLAMVIWDGVIESTTWKAGDDSRFCFKRNEINYCYGIEKNNNGDYIQSYQGEEKTIPANKIFKGRVFYNYYR